MDMSDIELVWAAGFFDGEGCARPVKATKHHGKQVRVQVSQTFSGKFLLDRFQRAVGVGKVMGPYKQGGGHGLAFVFVVHRPKEFETIMLKLWPYIGQIKRDQFTQVLAWYKGEL